MLFATQLQATLELKLSPHLWSLLVRKTCDILRSAPCIPDSVNADQFTIFLPPSKFSNRKGTNCAFLRSQLPWFVHGSVPQLCFLCFTQLMTTERLCLGLGHIMAHRYLDYFRFYRPHGNQAPSNTSWMIKDVAGCVLLGLAWLLSTNDLDGLCWIVLIWYV